MKHVAIGFILAVSAGSAGAQVSSLETATPSTKKGDPDQVVCERQEATGTRLGARQVCLTVAQWEAKRREHRDATEKVQRIQNQSPSN
ncbi:MAG TPA: hypothetical protein VM265_01030 [Sphingomicrobium sp.]|nr:hypothetical protein [Sphingomicrobium sp.]